VTVNVLGAPSDAAEALAILTVGKKISAVHSASLHPNSPRQFHTHPVSVLFSSKNRPERHPSEVELAGWVIYAPVYDSQTPSTEQAPQSLGQLLHVSLLLHTLSPQISLSAVQRMASIPVYPGAHPPQRPPDTGDHIPFPPQSS